ncbi:hypothetical protein GCM10023085_26500 [Actinomadura viridis]|uniref:Anti-sigma factor RsiW n=1 Tax=Actinomadura viridis TaxID=58110 RepID=A0A931GHF4_9ACTN|nr:zf-HC2 domain-containing protein [Actinomadura viridis]MBG6087363.1 anti-sigma factor RsiW [Actinomadura viridis]
MSCLGERLTALVDGELGHAERDRALAHLAGCARCRAEADSLRSLKNRLRGLGDIPVAEDPDALPTNDFMARLRGLGDPGGTGGGPDDPPATGRSRPDPAAPPPARRSRDERPGGRAADTRPLARPVPAGPDDARPARRYLAVGAATLVIGLGAASYAAGGHQQAPAVSPAFDRFAVEHALTSGDVPLTDQIGDRTSVPPAPEP